MRLPEDEVARRLSGLPGWQASGSRIAKKYRFKDFRQAMHFVNQVAEVAEARDHHPDILIHYNQVTLEWWSWAHQGVTELDLELAAACDAIYERVPHYGG